MNRYAKVYKVHDKVRELPVVVNALRKLGLDPDNLSLDDMSRTIGSIGVSRFLAAEAKSDRRDQDQAAPWYRRLWS